MTFEEKQLTVHPVVSVNGRSMKCYHVANDTDPIDPAVVSAAVGMLPELVPEPDEETAPAGWIIVHRGRDGAAYLNTYSWVWGNVVEANHAAAGQSMVGCPDDDPTHFVRVDKPWVGCIWELPPFGHERNAWVRHVFSQDEPDLAGYLADTMAAGPTGGPDH